MPGRLTRRSAVLIACAALAAAAALALLWRGGDRVEMRELVAALNGQPARTFEGRLAGDVSHAPLAPQRRGPAPEVSADVRIAAARLEQLVKRRDTAAATAALGAAYLALGDPQKAVDALEDAAQREPGDARIQNDLAAAYLARGQWSGQVEDVVRALAAADRAIGLDAAPPFPYFNRALALRGLHLSTEESAAWSAYTDADSGAGWTAEADGQRRAAALRQRRSADERAAVPDRQRLREQIEDRLFADWGAAVERGDRTVAATFLAEARSLADRLANGGDAMARDEVQRIDRAIAGGGGPALRDLAVGHRLFGEARAQFTGDRLPDAIRTMSEAAVSLRRAGSPYAHWSTVFDGTLLRLRGEGQASVDRFSVDTAARSLPDRYFHLRGRLAWAEGLSWENLGRYDRARDFLLQAVAAYEGSGEFDNLIAVHGILAEAHWFLGERGDAWSSLERALSVTDRRGSTTRVEHFDVAARVALGSGLPEVALDFQNELGRMAVTPRSRAENHVLRARTLLQMRDAPAALLALDQAADALPGVAATPLRDRIAADIDAARAEALGTTDCTASLARSAAAMTYFERIAGTLRRVALLTVQAGCRNALGDRAGAEADLRNALRLFESRRATIAAATDRVQAFELERAAYKQLIAIQTSTSSNAAWLDTAEQSRAGVVAEAWRSVGGRVGPERLPPHVAVVYYESLPDQVLVAVLTHDRQTSFSRPIDQNELARTVGRIQRAIRQGADTATLRPVSASFSAALVEPALQLAGTASAVVFIPDGVLFGVPFAVLPDASGRPLLATHTVAVAPSLSTFVAASSAMAGFSPSSVLAIGDGHDVAASGLARLARADTEAEAVAAGYPTGVPLTGAQATRRRVFETRADVLHFAGHTVLNERYPRLSRMLLAPDRAGRDSGWLLGADVTAERFGHSRVVFLATCEGAAGRALEGEGALSMATAFFGAGVPAVVASLWPVDDDLQTLMLTFHRTLRTGRDAAQALRAAQLSLLKERGPRTPIRAWGGFIMLGGLTPGTI
jgi:CHAT domain-containing protein